MVTLQDLSEKTYYMMEQMRQNAIDSTIAKFKDAARSYYRNGCDNGETRNLVRELLDLGVDLDAITDIEFEIREEILGT